MKVSIVSFSYPRGVPDDLDDDYWGGFVFDCRSLPDPHGIAALKGLSGLDKPVIDFFEPLGVVSHINAGQAKDIVFAEVKAALEK